MWLIWFAMAIIANANKLDNDYYNTTSGLYRAKIIDVNSTYIHQLKGIHYAEKPNRYELPTLRTYASHDIHDEREALACYQQANFTSYGDFELLTIPRMTEDCLTLNAYIPIEDIDNGPYPVMVVIHGGSNVVGHAELFDGSILAAHGKIIVVAINYRLGILGFLSSKTKKYPGNYGLHDQILALKWLKLNCKILNCDPNRITLWGHSAGGGDVMWLTLSSKSNNLFQRAIIQSGSAMSYWGLDHHPEQRYKGLRNFFNCSWLPLESDADNKNLELLIEECLSKKSPDELNEYKFSLLDWPSIVSDSDLIDVKHSAAEMIDNAVKIDIMTGINSIEGYEFSVHFNETINFWQKRNIATGSLITLERYSMLSRDTCLKKFSMKNRKYIESFYEDYVSKLLITSSNLSPHSTHILKERLKLALLNSAMIFDLGFIEFVKKLSNAKIGNSSNKSGSMYVYGYFYENQHTNSNYGDIKLITKDKNFAFNSHFDSMDFIFGLPIATVLEATYKSEHTLPYENFNLNLSYSQRDVDFSKTFMDYISNFVKNGNPNKGSLVRHKWHEYGKESNYLRIDESILHEAKKTVYVGLRDDLHKFWYENLNYHSDCKKNEESTRSLEAQKIDNCYQMLKNVPEYREIDENFSQLYDSCVETENYMPSLKAGMHMSTFCLDVMVVSRLLIEYRTCCNVNVSNGINKNVTSTLCDVKINANYINSTSSDLISNFGQEALDDLLDIFRLNTPSIQIGSTSHFSKLLIISNLLLSLFI